MFRVSYSSLIFFIAVRIRAYLVNRAQIIYFRLHVNGHNSDFTNFYLIIKVKRC